MSSVIRPRVLFICMGNICRSPTAEAVFRKLVSVSSLAGKLDIDSAGTASYHLGAAPDPRAVDVGAQRGYDLSVLRARQVTVTDFELFDYVVAMDENNVRHLKSLCPDRLAHRIELLLQYGGEEDEYEVPDPYYGTLQDFEHALDLIEEGCRGLLQHLLDEHRVRGLPGLKRDN